MGIRKLGDTITLDFTTHNPFTGAIMDTDLIPTCEIFEDDNDSEILTPTVTKRVNKIGNYRISIITSVGNGFEIGKSYNVIISATVNNISAKSRIESFVLDSKRINDLNDISETNINLIKIETDKIQSDIIDDKDSYKADVSGLATETNLNTKSSQDSVDEVKEDTESIITTLSTLVADVWAYTNRVLTDFGSLITDIWTNITRTLTVGTKDAEIDSIKSTVESLDLELDGVAKETSSQEILVAMGDITSGGLTIEQDAILRRTLGLSQENYRIFNPTYEIKAQQDCMTSATIRLYLTATDCNNDVNFIAEYNIIATFDNKARMTNYKVTKV